MFNFKYAFFYENFFFRVSSIQYEIFWIFHDVQILFLIIAHVAIRTRDHWKLRFLLTFYHLNQIISLSQTSFFNISFFFELSKHSLFANINTSFNIYESNTIINDFNSQLEFQYSFIIVFAIFIVFSIFKKNEWFICFNSVISDVQFQIRVSFEFIRVVFICFLYDIHFKLKCVFLFYFTWKFNQLFFNHAHIAIRTRDHWKLKYLLTFYFLSQIISLSHASFLNNHFFFWIITKLVICKYKHMFHYIKIAYNFQWFFRTFFDFSSSIETIALFE